MPNSVKKNKKIKKFILIKKTIKLSLILFFLLFLSYFIFMFFIKENIKTNLKISNIDQKIAEAASEIKELDRKASLIKNYIDIWNKEISETQKKTDNLDMEEIKTLISDISTNYSIDDINISFSIPNKINDKNKVNLLNTEITINFNCLTEYSVYYLLKDLYESKHAFFLLEELEIRKIRNIDKDLIKLLISEGNADILSVMIKLQWYKVSEK